MKTAIETAKGSSFWLVGASYGGTDDQVARFVRDGTWDGSNEDKYIHLVQAVQPGDRIAIKAAYTRRRELPFENRDQTVSVMAIKAVGTVTQNLGDGRRLGVAWTEIFDPPREWYFYTSRSTIWQVRPGDWKSDALIDFVFNNGQQNFAEFRNAPFWRERFGDVDRKEHRFQWTRFYEAVADKLLLFREDRGRLIAGIHAIAGRVDAIGYLQDEFADGSNGPLQDICPFTAFGIFNRSTKDANRKLIAKQFAELLRVEVAVPKTFEGVPLLNNQNSWFFHYEKFRKPGDIDALWKMYAGALQFADSDAPDVQDQFLNLFDDTSGRPRIAWNLTFALFWIRPWVFVPLDSRSRLFLDRKLGLEVGSGGHKGLPSAAEYLALTESLKTRFMEEAFPVHSVPEFSHAAWIQEYSETTTQPPVRDQTGEVEVESSSHDEIAASRVCERYAVESILADGCFLDRSQLDNLLERLRTKKNLILQGPPGTGKTWVAKRLAFALIGERDESRIRVLQFHPNMSYEDFVRGWRPSGDGKLELVDGPLMEVVSAAAKLPAVPHVLVIEEINRGNPAQIFGEVLTLLEADKRTPDEAIELCHRRERGERVFIPENVFLIGTMNLADRSLALVDFALRRRFAFVNLEPRFGEQWRNWVAKKYGIDTGFLLHIEQRMVTLNNQIASDGNLGGAFRIGHSYITPSVGIQISDPLAWYVQVVETEIGPLLDEYWYDSIQTARDARKRLIEAFE